MALNPLSTITDYQSLQNRVFWFTTVATLGAVWLIRASVPAADAALGHIDRAMGFGLGSALPTPGGYLVPALAVGIASRVFRLHALISDALGIRECFDLEAIIGKMSEQVRVDLSGISYDELRAARPRLMRQTFYAYVSGERPAIDQHLVQQALDAWSWLWAGVEATFVFTLAAFALIGCGAYQPGFETLGCAIAVAVFGLPMLRRQCARYATAQVRAILSDPARATAVRAELAELAGRDATRRAAA